MAATRKYGKKADLALDTWVKLARAFSTVYKKENAQIRSYGLTQPQFSALECLGHLGPMTIGELSKKMLVSGGNMTVVIDNLEKEGLVERIHSQQDRRAILVQLTPKGKQLFEEVFVKHAAYLADLFSVLTEEEQRELGRLLKKLGVALKQEI